MKNMYLQISTWQLIESRKCYNRWGRYLQKPWCHPECCNKIYNVILYQASTLTYFSTCPFGQLTRNVCITKYARLNKLSNGKKCY